jgi:hypothetical protein
VPGPAQTVLSVMHDVLAHHGRVPTRRPGDQHPGQRPRPLPSVPGRLAGPYEVYRRFSRGQSSDATASLRPSGLTRCPRTGLLRATRRNYPPYPHLPRALRRWQGLKALPRRTGPQIGRSHVLLHVCSDVPVPFDNARYETAPKWAESRTERHRQALSGSRRTRNSGLLIRGFGVQVPGGTPVLTWGFINLRSSFRVRFVLMFAPCLLGRTDPAIRGLSKTARPAPDAGAFAPDPRRHIRPTPLRPR